MKGNIYTSQKCSVCGGALIYNSKRGNCYCPEHDTPATGGYFVRFGRGHFKRFHDDIRKAEQHLNFIRAQSGDNLHYGQYDPRDWKRNNPLGLEALGKQWLERKSKLKPPLTPTRMHELKVSIDRAVAFWGDVNIKALTVEDLNRFYLNDHTALHSNALLSSKTVFNLCSNIQEFITWGCKVALVEAPRFENLGYEENETQPITIDQQRAIVAWIKKYCPEPRIWFAVQCLSRNANIRPSELCALQWKDIDRFSGVAYIRKDKNRRRNKRKKVKDKIMFIDEAQLDYLRTQKWGALEDFFFVYTNGRSGVKEGQRIHSKRLNHWFRKGAEVMNIDTTLYAGTKHTTATGLGRHIDHDTIRKGGTGHAANGAYWHYQHDHLSEQIRVQRVIDEIMPDSKLKIAK